MPNLSSLLEGSAEAHPDRTAVVLGGTRLTYAQVDAAAKAYRVYYQKVGEGDSYTVNHAAYSYLMNPKGRFACVLPYDLTPEQTAAKIKAAIAAI